MSRPIRATIDLGALRRNLGVARRHAGSARIWSVIKADAYGHGLLRCAQALAGLTEGYALLDLEDALRLRQAGLAEPILLLEGFFSPYDLAPIAEQRLVPVLHCAEQVEMLRSAALPSPVPVYVKVNTGMNRLGFPPANVGGVLQVLRGLRAVGEITLMTHFARADETEGIAGQLARFEACRREWPLPASLANSAALLRFPEARGDWVRPGIMLYGGSPCPGSATAAAFGLRPVMTLASEIIGVQQLESGAEVGYGASYTASGPMRIGIVACGYADGYPRHAGSGTPVLVEGVRTATVGRVSMDMLAVDLTPVPQARVGSPVVLWGDGLPADEVAAAAGTISYELFCALARRVPVSVRPAA